MHGAADQTEALQSGPPGIVRLTEGLGRVAVLFAREDSNYKKLDAVDVWDKARDALKWPGGNPVVAHPPCRSWGVLAHFAKPAHGERELAPWAVEQVRKWGGVLEHPKGSALWGHCKLPAPGERDKFGGWTKPVLQMWWGHRAEKPTLLYIVGCEPRDLPSYPLELGEAPRVLFNKRGLRAGMPGFRTECTREEREHTPPELARWLVELARRCARPNVGGEARLAAHQPSQTTTATPQGVASTDQLGGRVRSEKD